MKCQPTTGDGRQAQSQLRGLPAAGRQTAGPGREREALAHRERGTCAGMGPKEGQGNNSPASPTRDAFEMTEQLHGISGITHPGY